MHDIRFSCLARLDIDATYDWYQTARTGLGDGFMMQLEAAVARLIRHPEIAAVYYDDVRRIVLRRFPYSVYYRVTEVQIEVLGVRPFAADPASLIGRLTD